MPRLILVGIGLFYLALTPVSEAQNKSTSATRIGKILATSANASNGATSNIPILAACNFPTKFNYQRDTSIPIRGIIPGGINLFLGAPVGLDLPSSTPSYVDQLAYDPCFNRWNDPSVRFITNAPPFAVTRFLMGDDLVVRVPLVTAREITDDISGPAYYVFSDSPHQPTLLSSKFRYPDNQSTGWTSAILGEWVLRLGEGIRELKDVRKNVTYKMQRVDAPPGLSGGLAACSYHSIGQIGWRPLSATYPNGYHVEYVWAEDFLLCKPRLQALKLYLDSPNPANRKLIQELIITYEDEKIKRVQATPNSQFNFPGREITFDYDPVTGLLQRAKFGENGGLLQGLGYWVVYAPEPAPLGTITSIKSLPEIGQAKTVVGFTVEPTAPDNMLRYTQAYDGSGIGTVIQYQSVVDNVTRTARLTNNQTPGNIITYNLFDGEKESIVEAICPEVPILERWYSTSGSNKGKRTYLKKRRSGSACNDSMVTEVNYHWKPNGSLEGSTTTANGQSIELVVDQADITLAGGLKQKAPRGFYARIPGHTGVQSAQISYSRTGTLASVTNEWGTTQFVPEYDQQHPNKIVKVSSPDANGNRSEVTYDELGRQTTASYINAQGDTLTSTFAYQSPAGLMSNATLPQFTISNTYTAPEYGRVLESNTTAHDPAISQTVRYAYNPLAPELVQSVQTTSTDTDGDSISKTISFTYDPNMTLLKRISASGSGIASTILAEYNYDDASRLLYSCGTGGLAGSSCTHFSYYTAQDDPQLSGSIKEVRINPTDPSGGITITPIYENNILIGSETSDSAHTEMTHFEETPYGAIRLQQRIAGDDIYTTERTYLGPVLIGEQTSLLSQGRTTLLSNYRYTYQNSNASSRIESIEELVTDSRRNFVYEPESEHPYRRLREIWDLERGDSVISATMVLGFDSENRPIESFQYQRGRGYHQLSQAYDLYGNLTFAQIDSNRTDFRNYNSFGTAREIEDWGKIVTVNDPDISGDLVGSTVTTVNKVNDPALRFPQQVTAHSDALGRLARKVSAPWGVTENYIYGGPRSELLSITTGYNNTFGSRQDTRTFIRDTFGRVIESAFNNVRLSKVFFSGLGLVTDSYDSQNHERKYFYDDHGHLQRLELPDGKTIQYERHFSPADPGAPEGSRYSSVKVLPGNKRITTYFDKYGRAILERGTSQNSELYRREFEYPAGSGLNEPLRITYQDSQGERVSSTSYTRNDLGFISEELIQQISPELGAAPIEQLVSYDYYDQGPLRRISYPLYDFHVMYERDAERDHRIENIKVITQNGGNAEQAVTYSYDGPVLTSREVAQSVRREYKYNASLPLLNQVLDSKGGPSNVLSDIRFDYTASFLPKELDNSRGLLAQTQTFGYNDQRMLSTYQVQSALFGAQSESPNPDVDARLDGLNYTPMFEVGGYSYDSDGNVLSTPAGLQFSWSPSGSVRCIRRPASSASVPTGRKSGGSRANPSDSPAQIPGIAEDQDHCVCMSSDAIDRMTSWAETDCRGTVFRRVEMLKNNGQTLITKVQQ